MTWSRPSSRTGAAAAALAALIAGLTAGCSSSAPAAATSPSCPTPHQASMPDSAALLTNADSGSFCVTTGGKIDVLLAAPTVDGSPQGHWAGVENSNPDVLRSQSTSTLGTTPAGVTPSEFLAAKKGTTELTSTRSDGKTWHVTIVVQG